MTATLCRGRDKPGHGRGRAAGILLVLLLVPWMAAAAGPGAYRAGAFDVSARILQGGSLEVHETIAFVFESGTFKKVWREIPVSGTDGVEIVEARMDGAPVTRGEGPGHVVISGRNRIRVEWQFAPAGPSRHTFELRYVARGVAYRDGKYDVMRWRLLPEEHRYRIASSHGAIAAAVAPAAPATISARHVDASSIDQAGTIVTTLATGVRNNGSLVAEVRYPAGSLTAADPAWRQRELAAGALAPRWAATGAGIFILAVLVLLVSRQGYDTPASDTGPATTTAPPDNLPVALSAALASNGRASGPQALATLLDLADRGVLTVRELPRRFGVRQYELRQVPGKHDLADHELETLTMAFAGGSDDVPLQKARGRLIRGGRRFAHAVTAELAERGLLDPSRKTVRDRVGRVALVMMIAAAVAAVGVSALIPRYQGWPFLIPLGLFLAGVVGVVMFAGMTPLSDEGLMQGARWRGFKTHLKRLADARDDVGAPAMRSRWIVYGIALGIARQWSHYLKRHPEAVPAWFVAAAPDDAGGAFAFFVASNGAGAGGGGGGAAGGGSSGAG